MVSWYFPGRAARNVVPVGLRVKGTPLIGLIRGVDSACVYVMAEIQYIKWENFNEYRNMCQARA